MNLVISKMVSTRRPKLKAFFYSSHADTEMYLKVEGGGGGGGPGG